MKIDFSIKPWAVLAGALALVALVGVADYLTGYELQLHILYIVIILAVTWLVGPTPAYALAVLSVAVWIAGDLAAGVRFSSYYIASWNTLIVLGAYLILVWLAAKLRAMKRELEERVRQRTQALAEEVTERERLGRELVQLTEREQQRIGHDLHDVLGQHLTGTALASQYLHERLAERQDPDAAAAERITRLVEQGIEITRDLARGLSAVAVKPDDLLGALLDLASRFAGHKGLTIRLDSPTAVSVPDSATATQLFRIAQEAVTNAVKYSQASEIVIRLGARHGRPLLEVRDNGIGLPATRPHEGLGIRLMAYRARLIGAQFEIDSRPGTGTTIRCFYPAPNLDTTP